MGRAPCCEKVGLKRGPWTSEEDQILINFVRQHGHSNWRALPKLAGLLRCGKSCRLRWINYLKPDIKRGNFSKEEEDTIVQLHEMMGNKWSAIAAKLPGRTDNEIKNVWHTHLKKRLNKQNQIKKSQSKVHNKHYDDANNLTSQSNSTNSNSSQQSFSSDGFSSITDVSSLQEPYSIDRQKYDSKESDLLLLEEIPMIDDSFWSTPELSYEEFSMDFEFPDSFIEDAKISTDSCATLDSENNSSVKQVDFWLNVLVKAGGASELPEFWDNWSHANK